MMLVSQRWWAPALHHSPNEELDATARQLAASMGTRPGFLDYVLIIRSGNFVGLAFELKAPKPHGRKPTRDQRVWLSHFTEQDWLAKVAYGADHALKILDDYIALGATRPTL